MIRSILYLAAFIILSVNAYAQKIPVVPNKVQEKYVPAGLSRLNGLLNDHVMINLEKRLLRIDSATLLTGFERRPGPQTWVGEHIGKFLFSASNTYRYTHDQRLKELMEDMLKRYIATQLPDGYLGTYLAKDYWSGWDVWAHKYAIVGLINYYSVTGYSPALQAAIKAGDLICRTFGDEPGKLDLNKSGKQVGMASGSILEPMIDLYRYTGDQKYLSFAGYILHNWETATGPKILGGLEQYGKVTKVGNGKAYEMMSCFVGILKYYTLTGDTRYLKAMQIAWQDIVDNRLYITGTASEHERFQDDHILSAETRDKMGEGCVTMSWIQFNEQLLKITGEIKYVEEIEKAVYNHLFAAENPGTGCVSYYTALQADKPYSCNQLNSCCLSSIPMGISSIPGLVWGNIDNEFSVLLYEAGEVSDSITAADGSRLLLQIKATTTFPSDGKAIYRINPSSGKKFSINFRIPAWSAHYTLTVNGVKQDIAGGHSVKVERVWKSNDRVIVRFDMPLQVLDGGLSYPGFIAFRRGPQVLAMDAVFNPPGKDLLPVSFDKDSKFAIHTANNVLAEGWVGKQAYSITLDTDKKRRLFILVPFADAGQQSTRQQVWIAPGRSGENKTIR
ncbi:MAG TPA: beta-L-arabinofuranosidase domain-containing protein [Puia sp.]|nr:beta-L-arabinofuranosidase domain-containing protein [Puia sp.]